MKIKLILLLVMILGLCGVVSAVDFEPDTDITLYAEYTEAGVYINSTAYITIEAPNGTIVINNESMTETATGRFSYQYTTPEEKGIYFIKVLFYVDGEYVGHDSKYVDVGIFDVLNFGVCPDTKQGQTNMWIILIIIVVMGMFGLLTNNIAFTLISGFGLIFMTLIVWSCGSIIGYLTILFGLIFILTGLLKKPAT